jgi:hypothetical protein
VVRLREPLPHSKRLALIGAYHYSGRATTTMVLGSLLATVRREPVLALDGSASEGALDTFLTHRNPAVVRDLAALPPPPSYEKIRARTTRLPFAAALGNRWRRLLSLSVALRQALDRAILHAVTGLFTLLAESVLEPNRVRVQAAGRPGTSAFLEERPDPTIELSSHVSTLPGRAQGAAAGPCRDAAQQAGHRPA